MKKIFVLTTCIFLLFSSCKKDDAFSEITKQDKEINLLASALVDHQHLDFPGPYDLINECNGETVTVTGTIGIDIHIVINGNKLNYSEHQQGQLMGTGSLGNEYVTNLNGNIILNGIESTNGVFIINDVTIFRMVSKGGGTNLIFRRNAHLTVNANGVVTVDRVYFETICQG